VLSSFERTSLIRCHTEMIECLSNYKWDNKENYWRMRSRLLLWWTFQELKWM